jgi:hypothetical protein
VAYSDYAQRAKPVFGSPCVHEVEIGVDVGRIGDLALSEIRPECKPGEVACRDA